MEILIYAGQLILGFSILVALHEFGHFLPAKLFGMRVEKFYLFFDWPWALVKKKFRGTEYGIGSLPFGGYVKISGMVDEHGRRSRGNACRSHLSHGSSGQTGMAAPDRNGGWRNGQRAVGLRDTRHGALCGGREYLPVKNLTYGVTPSALMKSEGFQDGDMIVDVDGRDPKTLGDVSLGILIDGARSVTVERTDSSGELVRKKIELSANIQERILESNDKLLFSPRFPFYVDSVLANNNAAKVGSFRKGDRIVALDGQPARYFQDFVEAVKDKKGQQVQVTLLREGHQVQVPVDVDENGIVGLQPRSPSEYFTFATERYTLLGSIPAGIKYGWQRLKDNVSSFKLLGSKAGMKQMGGLISMSKAYGPVWVWQRFGK